MALRDGETTSSTSIQAEAPLARAHSPFPVAKASPVGRLRLGSAAFASRPTRREADPGR